MERSEKLSVVTVHVTFVLFTLVIIFSGEGRQSELPMHRQAEVTPPTPLPLTAPLLTPAASRSVTVRNGLESLPASLEGTTVPDGLAVTPDGCLAVTPQLRDVLDYFLSTLGEESLDTIEQRLQAYFASQLPGTAAREAGQILEGYIAWKRNLASRSEAGGVSTDTLDLGALREQQQWVRDSCHLYLDRQVCMAFFARQQVSEDYALARLAVVSDDTLTSQQKAEQLEALTASLPHDMQSNIAQISRYQELQRRSAQLRQDGGDEATLRKIREQWVGADAAARLEQLDSRREEFDRRMSQWLRERESLLGNTNLSRSDRQQQVEQLREAHFSSREEVRVKARERIADRS